MIPLIVGGALAAGAAYSAYKGMRGKKAAPYVPPEEKIDAQAYQYGGDSGATSRWREELANRDAQALAAANGSAAQAQQARGLQGDVYGRQGNVYDRWAAMADGTGPSLAREQLKAGLGVAQAQQTAAAANTRGGAANQLLGARQAAQMGSAMQGQANQQAAMVRAQEQMGAISGMGGAADSMGQTAGAMRAGDFTARGYDEQRASGALGARMGLEQQQLVAQMARDQATRDAFEWTQNARMGVSDKQRADQQAQKDRWMQIANGLMTTGATVVTKGGGFGSGGGGGQLCRPAGPPTSRTPRGAVTRCSTTRGRRRPSPRPRTSRRWSRRSRHAAAP